MSFLQSQPGDDRVVVEGLSAAGQARVFRAWAEPEQFRQWFLPPQVTVIAAEHDVRVGGRWRFRFAGADGRPAQLEGEYLLIRPHDRLEFSWVYASERADGSEERTAPSHVTVQFEAEGRATRVRLTHAGIATREGRQGVGSGWPAGFAGLAAWLAATGAGSGRGDPG